MPAAPGNHTEMEWGVIGMGDHILLVEDDPDDVEITLYSLDEAGVSAPVVVACDGAKAVEMLFGGGETGTPPELPAVVLLDMRLPRVSGQEIYDRLRDDPRTRGLPVVVLTGSDPGHDPLPGAGHPATAHAHKGGADAELQAALKAAGYTMEPV